MAGWPGGILFGSKEAAESGFCAEHGKKIRREANNADMLGRAVASEIFVAADRDGDLLEAGVVALDAKVLGGGEPVLRDVQSRGAIPEGVDRNSGKEADEGEARW